MAGAIANDQPVDVAIVGGGIIGLVLALGLIKRRVKVKVYEQARSFREIGAGVAFTANAIRCMHMLEPGIVDALKAVATSNGDSKNPNDWLQWVDGYNQHGEDPNDEKVLFKLYAGYKGFEGCHRAHFLDELVKIVPDGVVEFRKRLDTLFIGCDGIKSRVREILLGKENPASYPYYSHKVAYRGLIPMDKAVDALGDYKARNQHMHMGPGAHVLHFPVAGHTLMNVVAFVTDPHDWCDNEKMTAPATRVEVEEAFAKWGPTVRAITNLLPDELDKWAIFDTFDHPAPTYARGQICIAGDAAHASSPHHGAGAGIGVEDALCLGTLVEMAVSSLQVKGASKVQVLSMAFDTFNAVRRERSQWLVNSSRSICEVYEWANPKTGKDPEKCLEEIKWRSHKIWYFDINGMLGDAAEGYERRLKTNEG
ncbi:MAG: hypothetical protein M1830_009016 [Pleopsidium flavum]|nr:MAG: hypothetical protein M1830_009016 [Pleopsidium flavum]